MKVIDLLNKIANGEEVPKVDFGEHVYKYNKNLNQFEDVDNDDRYIDIIPISQLNDEVEEDKKIEKLEDYDFDDDFDVNAKCECLRERMFEIAKKVNEIIDHINNGDDE